MARYEFRVGKVYAGHLIRISTRPIENGAEVGIALLRMEFEIHDIEEPKKVLRSTGKIACRDLVVGKLIAKGRDSGIATYANALGMTMNASVSEWIASAEQNCLLWCQRQ